MLVRLVLDPVAVICLVASLKMSKVTTRKERRKQRLDNYLSGRSSRPYVHTPSLPGSVETDRSQPGPSSSSGSRPGPSSSSGSQPGPSSSGSQPGPSSSGSQPGPSSSGSQPGPSSSGSQPGPNSSGSQPGLAPRSGSSSPEPDSELTSPEPKPVASPLHLNLPCLSLCVANVSLYWDGGLTLFKG